MLLFLIKFYFTTWRRYHHFKDVVVDREHVLNAVKYANVIGKISEFEENHKQDYEISRDYAEFMLGHFVLNLAAAHSPSLFFKVLKCLPFNASESDEKLQRYIGCDVWNKHDNIDYPSRWLQVFDDMYGIINIKDKAFNVKKSTQIKFISSTSLWNSTIILILTNQIAAMKLKDYLNSEDRERLKVLHSISVKYGCTAIINDFKKDMENGNTTKDKRMF